MRKRGHFGWTGFELKNRSWAKHEKALLKKKALFLRFLKKKMKNFGFFAKKKFFFRTTKPLKVKLRNKFGIKFFIKGWRVQIRKCIWRVPFLKFCLCLPSHFSKKRRLWKTCIAEAIPERKVGGVQASKQLFHNLSRREFSKFCYHFWLGYCLYEEKTRFLTPTPFWKSLL